MSNLFWSIWSVTNSLKFWVVLLVIFFASLIFRFYFSKRLLNKVGNDPLLPRVKEMLSGKLIQRKELMEVKNKLLVEGVEQKRVGRLIGAAVTSKVRKFPVWLIVAMVLILVIEIFRAHSLPSSSIVTPVGPTVYNNMAQGYEITLPQNWVGIKSSKSPNSIYFGNQNPTSDPIGIEIRTTKTQQDISSSTIQQQIVQSVYTSLVAQNQTTNISEDLTSQPPYVEYASTTSAYGKVYSRRQYFFGNGMIYDVLTAAPENEWAIATSEADPVIATFKIDTN